MTKADVELVIKIPKEIYEYWKNHSHEYVLAEAIKNGTLLPKGHGRLIDADVLVDGMEDDYEFCEATNATPTIIEADKAENEDKK